MTPIARLDEHIADLRRTLDDAIRLRALLAGNPALAEALGDVSAALTRPRPGGGPVARANLAIIQDALSRGGNNWMTAEQIIQASGLSQQAVTHVLYKPGRDAFEKRNAPGNGKLKQWRLAKKGES